MKQYTVKELATFFEVEESQILTSDGAVMVFREDRQGDVVSAIKDHKKTREMAVERGEGMGVLSSDVHISSEEGTLLMSLMPTKMDWPDVLKRGSIGTDAINWACYATLLKKLFEPGADLTKLLDDISEVYILVGVPKRYVEKTALEAAERAGGLTFAMRR